MFKPERGRDHRLFLLFIPRAAAMLLYWCNAPESEAVAIALQAASCKVRSARAGEVEPDTVKSAPAPAPVRLPEDRAHVEPHSPWTARSPVRIPAQLGASCSGPSSCSCRRAPTSTALRPDLSRLAFPRLPRLPSAYPASAARLPDHIHNGYLGQSTVLQSTVILLCGRVRLVHPS